MSFTTRAGGRAAIVGALLAISGNIAVLAAEPAVAEDRVSYPLSTGAYAGGQVFFALTQALMAAGIYALIRCGAVRPGRRATVFGGMALTGMLLTVPGELVLIPVAARDVDSAAAGAASSVFGLGVLLADVGLIGYGVLALRERRSLSSLGAMSLALGVFQLFVVTPVSLSQGFASAASFVVIAVANLLTALLGMALIQTARTDGSQAAVADRHRDVDIHHGLEERR